jgi:hypothetical protein
MVIFMSIMMGTGVAVIVSLVERHLRRRSMPKTLADWLPALERANLAVVYASSELAQRVKELAVLRDEMPPECQRIADQVLHYTQVVEEQLFEELAERGIVPRYMFGGPVSDLAKTRAGQDATIDPVVVDVEVEAESSENVIALPSQPPREWVGRQLLRRL